MISESYFHLPKDVKTIFFIGIGGISMSSLARLARHSGYAVLGSDRSESPMVQSLRAEGITVYPEHRASNLGGSDLVVYTAAVNDTNPELAHAKERGIPCLIRADFLGRLIENYQTKIGVCGMHGKSTTTSMISHLFLAAEKDPSIISGAEINELHSAYRLGGEAYMIFEADEYKAAFHSFPTDIAVCLNAELDHVDFYPNLDAVVEAFRVYLHRAPCAVVNKADDEVMMACEGYEGRLITFSMAGEADVQAKNIRMTCDRSLYELWIGGEKITDVVLSAPGPHNVADSLAALAAAYAAGLDVKEAALAMTSFGGTKRRGEYKGTTSEGVLVYDDYAHHPSEIRASLAGFKAMGHKVICLYQPHTYSRTIGLFEEFVKAFDDADEVVFAEIFAAREQNTTGISSADLAAHIEGARFYPTFEQIAADVKKNAEAGDIVITMGAGDVYKIGDMLLGK